MFQTVYHFRNFVAARLHALGVVASTGLPYSAGEIHLAADLVWESGLSGCPEMDLASAHVTLAF